MATKGTSNNTSLSTRKTSYKVVEYDLPTGFANLDLCVSAYYRKHGSKPSFPKGGFRASRKDFPSLV